MSPYAEVIGPEVDFMQRSAKALNSGWIRSTFLFREHRETKTLI